MGPVNVFSFIQLSNFREGGDLTESLEFWVRIDYNIDVNKKESTHSKSGCLTCGFVS